MFYVDLYIIKSQQKEDAPKAEVLKKTISELTWDELSKLTWDEISEMRWG